MDYEKPGWQKIGDFFKMDLTISCLEVQMNLEAKPC